MKVTLKTTYMDKGDYTLKIGKYNTGQTAISIIDEEGAAMMTATVNIDYAKLKEDELIIKSYSENEGLLQALIKAEVVEDTGKCVPCGFVNAYIVRAIGELKKLINNN